MKENEKECCLEAPENSSSMLESLEKIIERDDLPKFKKIKKTYAGAIECFAIAAKYDSKKIGLYLYKTRSLTPLTPSDIFKSYTYKEFLFYLKFVILHKPHEIIYYVMFYPSVFDYALTKGLLDVTTGENLEWQGKHLMYRLATIGSQWDQLNGALPVDLDYYHAMNCMRIQPTFLHERNEMSLPDDMVLELALHDNVDVTSIILTATYFVPPLSLEQSLLFEKWRPIFLRSYSRGIDPQELIKLICMLIINRDESSLKFLRDHHIKPSEEYLKPMSLIVSS